MTHSPGADPDHVERCLTCSGHGMIGGYVPWGDGEVDSVAERCPDCGGSGAAQPSADVGLSDDAVVQALSEEDIARAICRGRGRNPDCQHDGPSPNGIEDGIRVWRDPFLDGDRSISWHYGWRNFSNAAKEVLKLLESQAAALRPAPAEGVAVPERWRLFHKVVGNFIRCSTAPGTLSPYVEDNGITGYKSPWQELRELYEELKAAPPATNASGVAAPVERDIQEEMYDCYGGTVNFQPKHPSPGVAQDDLVARLLAFNLDTSDDYDLAREAATRIATADTIIEGLRADNERLTFEIQRLHPNPADYRYWEGRYRDEAARTTAAEAKLAGVEAERRAAIKAAYDAADNAATDFISRRGSYGDDALAANVSDAIQEAARASLSPAAPAQEKADD